ncbi:hypothetical protein [Scytonema sp. NUACC21]
MKQVVMKSFGGLEVLGIGEVEIPEPTPGEVLIRMEASGIN